MMEGWPREIRRWLHWGRRWGADCFSGRRRRFVSRTAARTLFPGQLTLAQPILFTPFVEAKRHNLELARCHLDHVPIPPGGILSFWHLIGRPTARRGFQPGRSLLAGQLRADWGGGLCQLSGLIYQLSLIAGLPILERHPHSVDIYDDSSRYAPLGADATVAYGFKDLRVLNNLAAPISFRVLLTGDQLTCCLCSPSQIQPCRIEYVQTAMESNLKKVETRRYRPDGTAFEVMNVSRYAKMTVHEPTDEPLGAG